MTVPDSMGCAFSRVERNGKVAEPKAMTKKAPKKSTNEGFLTSAAQAIGATLGQLAKKAGVTSSAESPKAPAKKTAARRKKAPIKRKTLVKRPK
jgi:hypothetical protein